MSILLLHGALGSQRQLFKVKEALQEHSEVYSLDFSGHGDNRTELSFAIDQFTSDVVHFLDENGLDQVNIFGYSMGGYVALNLAHHHEHRVNRIATYGTKFNWTPESAQKEVKMLNPEVIEQKVPKFAAHLESTHGAKWKGVMRSTAQMMIDLGEAPNLTSEVLSSINHRVLITVGDEDTMVSIEESKRAAASLSNSEFKILEGFQHPIERVNAGFLATMTLGFFNA
ncbi:alpha/beta fold hydrolase [Sanyastnella coralliicola]|uniref:alpha/beta fold hydrolase n=1 Tax=Sanyastnella coralliicola TaxID=3069118 RepID=UPI0027B9E810|nr:alpha/beta hydrolase [Longitalea sp. SCSIO 12813]